MLVHRLRRWPNIEPTILFNVLRFSGMLVCDRFKIELFFNSYSEIYYIVLKYLFLKQT